MKVNRLLLLLLFLSRGTGLLVAQGAASAPVARMTVVPAQAAQNEVAHGLKASASALSFGNEQLHSTSAPQLITITNPGKSEVVLSQVSSSASDFKLVHNCSYPMPAGGMCGISVRFVPGAVGPRNGTITIMVSGDLAPSPLMISLEGNGVDSAISLSETYLTFRTLLVGLTSTPQFVRLTNRSSTASATISRIAVSPDFLLAPTAAQCTASTTLAPLGSCTIAVVWIPSDSGSRSGRVTIADSASASPHIIDLRAIGTGVRLSSAALAWDPTAVGVTGSSQTMEVKNEGRTSIEIANIEASGDFYQQNNCGKQLHQHQSCSITAWFQPTAAGKRIGTVLIRDSDPTAMQQIFLSGVGSPLDLSPAKIDFGDYAVDSTSAPQTVTIINRSTGDVSISAVNVGGDFVVPAKTCGDRIAAGHGCLIRISFSPTTQGERKGALSIESGSVGIPQTVSLTGTGR
jgi:hypothetical protein